MIPIKIISSKKLKVIWQITNACTYKCSYCPKELNQGQSFPIDLEQLCTFLDKIENKNPVFTFTGGEPTIHPQYLDVLKELKKRKINVISDSNLSRTNRFYQEASDLVDNWCITLHPSEHILDIDKIKILTQRSYVMIYLMADPRHWDLVMTWFKELKKVPMIKIVILKPLDNWSNSGWYYNEYTKEQLQFYESTSPIVNFTKEQTDEILLRYPWLLDQGSTVVWNNGDKELLDSDKLMKDNLNKFNGWRCEVGEEIIVINPTCDISLGTCGIKQLGNWNKFNIAMLTDPVICSKDYCHCGIDIKSTKTKL